jgi:predicted kinase
MSGQSGSGKTWLAQRLAPDLDAIHIRSDIERKRLAGLDETASSKSGVAAGLYGAEQTRAVYEHMVVAAESALAGGFATIVDATFSSREQRALFAKLAQRMGVRISVVLCEAPVELLRERIAQRQQAGRDASEADLAVLAWQRAHWEPVQPDESLQVIRLSTARVDAPEVTLRTLGSENQL